MTAWLAVDLGGVAARYFPQRRLDALAKATGLPAAEIDRRLFISGLDEAAELGDFTIESILQEIMRCLDDRLDQAELVNAWSQAFEPNLPLLDVLLTHADRCCLFTNNGPMIDLCLQGPLAVIAKSFDRIVCSWHASAKKPHQNAFAYVENLLKASPPDLLVIDDDVRNVDAAKQAGWSSCHYTSIDELHTALALISERRS